MNGMSPNDLLAVLGMLGGNAMMVGNGTNDRDGCKWCERGECWTHGGASKGKGKGKGKGKSWQGQQAVMQKKKVDLNWVTALSGAVGKKLKRAITKEEIVYIFLDAEENGKPMFQATVTCAEFVNEANYSSKPSPSKADAKKNAAKTAVQSEFPDEFAKCKKSISQAPVNFKAPLKGASKSQKSVRVNLNKDAKSVLYNAVSTILARPTTKADFVWEITQTGNSYSAQLQIPELDSSTFQGTSNTSKAAEASAAQMAMRKLGPIAKAKQEEKKEVAVASGKTGKKRNLAPEEKAKIKAQAAKFKAIDDSRKVWVGGLGENVTDGQLKAFFEKAGKVQLAEKMASTSTSAMVVYSNAIEVDKAVLILHGSVLAGSDLVVDKWKNIEKIKKNAGLS